MTVRRLVVVVLVAWLALGIAALIAFNTGDTKPADGRGDTITIEQSSAPSSPPRR